ncbi:hypothetical protein DFS34DRAFT_698228 [Phlyctochytrium arcticum]|nr:hypothetical protein DFS34DRAFT_698228 [Phlyctochytrium arcticum]
MYWTSSFRSSRRSEPCRLTSVVSSLLLAMTALGPFPVEALDVKMGLARLSHEMFALNNKMVVMGGSKYANPPAFDNVTAAADKNYLQTASIVTYDDWASKDTTIVSGQSLTTYAAACARWDTEGVICTGGLRPGHVAPDNLEVSAFSLSGFQAFAGIGVVNAGINSGNISIPARWDHAAVILGSTYYLFGGTIVSMNGTNRVSGMKAGPGEFYAVDLNTFPLTPKSLTASGNQASPSARANFCMVPLDSSSFFVFGGSSDVGNTESYLRDSWIYKVGSGWTAVPQTESDPSARVGPTCTFLRGKVWMFGGGTALATSNDIWSFDPNTNTWKKEFESKTNPDDGQPTNRYSAKMVGVGVHLIINGGTLDGSSAASDAGLYFFNTNSAKWATSAAQLQNIAAVPDSPDGSGIGGTKKSGLSGGIIGGIVAAVVLFAVGILLFFLRRRRNQGRTEGKQDGGQTLVTQATNKPTSMSALESGQQIRPESSATLGLAQRPEVSGTDFGNLSSITPAGSDYRYSVASSVPSAANTSHQQMHDEISVLPHGSSGSAVAAGAGAIGAAHAARQSQHASGSPLSNEVMAVPPTRTEQSIVVNRFEHDTLTDLPPSYDALPSSSGSSSSPTAAQAVDSGLTGPARVVPRPLNEKMGLHNTDSAKENELKAAVASDEKSGHTGMPHVGHVLFRPGGRQEPVSGDEIMISPGDVVYVKEMYADGWAQGWNSTTNVSGFFPYNCVRSA